jgi:hypothetical protein
MGDRDVGDQYSNALAVPVARTLNKSPGNGEILAGGDNDALGNQEDTLSHRRAARTFINSPDGTHWITGGASSGDLDQPVVQGFAGKMIIQGSSKPWLQELFLEGLQEQQDTLFRRVSLRRAWISYGAKNASIVQMGNP